MKRFGSTKGTPGLVISNRLSNSSIIVPVPEILKSWWIMAFATNYRNASSGYIAISGLLKESIMHNGNNCNYPPPTQPISNHQILEKAAKIISDQFSDKDVFCDAKSTQSFLSFKLGHYEREVFAIMILYQWN